MMDNSTLSKLDALPPVPLVVQEILLVLNRRDASIAELGAVIARDPGLSGRLVAAANAAFFSGLRPIYSIDEALMRLGLNRVRTTALAVLLGTRFNPRQCPAFSSRQHWAEAMKTADCAHKLARFQSTPGVAEAAYLAGLLHNIGMLVNAYAFPDSMQRALEQKLDHPERRLADIEREELGFDHYQSGAELMRRWGLPLAVVNAVGHHRNEAYQGADGELVRLVGYAAEWARTSFRVWPPRGLAVPEDKLRMIAESCQRERDQVEALAFMVCSAA